MKGPDLNKKGLKSIVIQCKTPKVNTAPRKVPLVSARDTAYVVCTRERLSRKVSYFRPEKATKSAKIALSHNATSLQKTLFALKNTHFQNDSTAEKKN